MMTAVELGSAVSIYPSEASRGVSDLEMSFRVSRVECLPPLVLKPQPA